MAQTDGMNKLKLYCVSLLAGLMLDATPSVLRLGGLKEISAPYVGHYQCEVLRIGGIQFPTKDVRLELSSNGEAKLYWKTLWGKEQSNAWLYTYDEESGVLLVTIMDGEVEKIFKIPFENGEIVVAESLSGKAFLAKFTRK